MTHRWVSCRQNAVVLSVLTVDVVVAFVFSVLIVVVMPATYQQMDVCRLRQRPSSEHLLFVIDVLAAIQ